MPKVGTLPKPENISGLLRCTRRKSNLQPIPVHTWWGCLHRCCSSITLDFHERVLCALGGKKGCRCTWRVRERALVTQCFVKHSETRAAGWCSFVYLAQLRLISAHISSHRCSPFVSSVPSLRLIGARLYKIICSARHSGFGAMCGPTSGSRFTTSAGQSLRRGGKPRESRASR
jgi:hypothetical protein